MYNTPIFEMTLEQVNHKLMFGVAPILVDDKDYIQELLYRHAELALEIANAQPGMTNYESFLMIQHAQFGT